MSNALTAKLGRVWVQPGGPNKPCYLLSCTDLGDISEPKGGIELLRCFDNDGKLKTVGQIESPADAVTTSLTTLLYPERSFLEKLNCNFALYALQRDGGKADVFSNYVRGQLLANARVASRTYAGLVARSEDAESTMGMDVEAWPPLWDVDQMDITQLTGPGTVALNAVITNMESRCQGELGMAALEVGQDVIAVSDGEVAAKGKVYISDASGASLAATAADPFAVAENIVAVARFYVGRATVRILVAKEGTGAAVQGQTAYSDDDGATWNVVSIGGAAVGHGPKMANGLFALDWRHIWIAGDGGYIYMSDDGGASWEAVESGVIMANDYNAVHFADESYGIAGGAGGVTAISNDGGLTWQAVTSPGADDITAVVRINKTNLWAGDDAGGLWYSEDEGVTWTERTGWTGSGTGAVKALGFFAEYFGFMVHDNASPVGSVLRTFNGGTDWEVISTPTNAGLNSLAIGNNGKAYVVGEASGGAPVVLRVEAA